MSSAHSVITATSSILLRIICYVFLRWPVPNVIFTLALVYLCGFIINIIATPHYKILADEIEVITTPVTPASNQNGEARLANGKNAKVDDEPLEEIDVMETIVVEYPDPRILKTLLTGLPSPSSLFWSLVTFLINVALFFMAMDLIYRAPVFYPSDDLSFARIGYVSSDSANVLVREPIANNWPVLLSIRYADVAISNPTPFDTAWKDIGNTALMTDSTDFTTSFTINHLQPDTRYQYALSNNHSGFFITAPQTGHVSSKSAFANRFTFLQTSCIIPHFPYHPLDHPLSVPGFKKLQRVLEVVKPAFMLFLGDFIYIDVPRRFGIDVATYRREYRQVYASPDWPLASTTTLTSHSGANEPYDIPWLHTWDDHELNDNWDANTTGIYASAVDPYLHYHHSVNPPAPFPRSPSPRLSLAYPPETYYHYMQGPATFFVMDTRTFRSPTDKTILGHKQLAALLSWLRAPVPHGVRWKIVVSSCPFTKNWHVHSHDTWWGYLEERSTILEAMWDVNSGALGGSEGVGVIVLSGDRHEFAATAFPPPVNNTRGWSAATATVTEFSVSPLNMFYLPIRTYYQDEKFDAMDGVSDVCIKYLPDGNSKVGAIEIESPTGSEQSLLRYRLFIDGVESWSHVLLTPPRMEGKGGKRWLEEVWG